MSDAPEPRPGPTVSAAESADKRTMVIAGLVMVGLVAVGIGSAAVFARSACQSIGPQRLDAGQGIAPGDGVVEEAFPAASADQRRAVTDALRWLEDRLGPAVGIVDVTGADALAGSDQGGLASLGSVTTRIAADGATASARADLGEGHPVGSGETLYSLAVANELTGQVDAVVPLDGDLDASPCVDTALVGTTLAFHLDAEDGQLLLLRVEEDGADPELELRDPVAGRVWGQRFEATVSPPGVLGERMSARLGADLVVAGRRTAPGDDSPVLTAVARVDGAPAWTASREDLRGVVDTASAQIVDVVALDEESVVVALEPDPESDVSADAAEPAGNDELAGDAELTAGGPAPHVLVLGVAEGNILWDTPLEPGDRVLDAATHVAGTWLVVAGKDDELRLLERGPMGEEVHEAIFAGTQARLAPREGGGVLVAHDRGFATSSGSEVEAFASEEVTGHDVAVHEAGTTVLLEGPGERALAVTFASRQ